ncbi:hypothetical protein MKW92_021536, partial [Papaver armeniacum]
MKNATRYKTENKKRYTKLNREKKRLRRAEELAAAAAAAVENAVPIVHLVEEVGPTNATNQVP